MTPKEALILHFTSIFPILGSSAVGAWYLWKGIAFTFCLMLASWSPCRYLWSGLLLLSVAPALLFRTQTDIISEVVHLYLIWMCAEISFRSINMNAASRLPLWWIFPVLLVICI